MSPDKALILIWTGFMIVGVSAASAILLWAIRTGQFGDQERARSLPLMAEVPAEDGREEKGVR